MRPMMEATSPWYVENQRLPSGAAMMLRGSRLANMPRTNSVTVPEGVIRPIWLALLSVNQTLPSGPAVMLDGLLAAVGMGKCCVGPPPSVIRVPPPPALPSRPASTLPFPEAPPAPPAPPSGEPPGTRQPYTDRCGSDADTTFVVVSTVDGSAVHCDPTACAMRSSAG